MDHKKMDNLSQFKVHYSISNCVPDHKFKGDKSIYDNVKRIFVDAISSLVNNTAARMLKTYHLI